MSKSKRSTAAVVTDSKVFAKVRWIGQMNMQALQKGVQTDEGYALPFTVT